MSTQLHRHTQIVRSPKDTAPTGQHANINTNTHYAITSSSANPDILRRTWLILGPDTHAHVLVTHSFNMYLLSYYYVLAIRKQYRTCLKHKHVILHTWAYCLADDKIEWPKLSIPPLCFLQSSPIGDPPPETSQFPLRTREDPAASSRKRTVWARCSQASRHTTHSCISSSSQKK